MHPPVYHYDPKLGSTHDTFKSANEVYPQALGPEIAGVFVVRVDGETILNSMWGQRNTPWTAEPGTPCVILGYWSDGTVQLRWPAIAGAYRVEGRFPGWVVRADPTTRLAGGGHMLTAHDPGGREQGTSPRRILGIVGMVVLILVVLALLLPQTREVLGIGLIYLRDAP